MENKRILQMMPAEGWYAKYVLDDGSWFMEKLICWVLVEANGETGIEGMDSGGGYTQFCEDVGNFDNYVYGSEGEKHGRE